MPLRTGRIWYVRSIGRTSATAAPDVPWAVIDDRTGLVLGYSMPQPQVAGRLPQPQIAGRLPQPQAAGQWLPVSPW